MTLGLLAISLIIVFAAAGCGMAQAAAAPANAARAAKPARSSALDIVAGGLDVMARALRADRQAAIRPGNKYIAKLYSEEFQVLPLMQHLCLADLDGRRVRSGAEDSASAIPAAAVFKANDISSEPLYLEHGEAIGRLKRGELVALVYTGGNAFRASGSNSRRDKVHFSGVEYSPLLQANHLPAIITPDRYPNLVAPEEGAGTIGVSYVMAVHDRPQRPERYRVMERFVERCLPGSGRLSEAGFSPKWHGISLQAPVKGGQSFEPAEQWLAANARPAAETARPRTAVLVRLCCRKPLKAGRALPAIKNSSSISSFCGIESTARKRRSNGEAAA